MLAPNINEITNRTTDAYNTVIALDNFSSAIIDLQVLTPPKDPKWLPEVRSNISLLKEVANLWRNNERPNTWSSVPLSFTNYITTFESIPDRDSNSNRWIEVLDTILIPTARNQKIKLEESENTLKNIQSKFSSILPLIDESIMKGWSELGKEEESMQTLATELGTLFNQVSAQSDKITADAININKLIITNSIKMLYATATEEEPSVPIFGILVSIVTIGKAFYDLGKDSEKIEQTMRKITEIQNALSNEAMALALTKSTLQILYNIEKQYLASKDSFPLLIDIWAAEESKLMNARNALVSGAKADQLLAVLTLPTAKSNWKHIKQFITKLSTIDLHITPPVILDINKSKVIQS